MAISGLDENGKSVDWWFAYKVPHISGTGPGPAIGDEYVYYDPNVGRVGASPGHHHGDSAAAFLAQVRHAGGQGDARTGVHRLSMPMRSSRKKPAGRK